MNDKNKSHSNIHRDLIKRCQNSDQKAQMEIYRLYYRAMYNTSLRIVGSTDEAEDIMQESFLKAFQKIKTYRGKVSFGAWLKKIVINHSLDSIRKKKLITEEIDNYSDIIAGEENTDVNENISTDDIIEEIKNLPDGYRIVLSLYLLEGYDHDEIARILKISASTSRSQYTRAKARLARNLKKKK